VFIKPEISANFFSDKVDYFQDFSHVLLKSIFSSYCLNSLIAKKSKREISRVFSAFRRSRQNKKMPTSFRFLDLASLIDSCQKMARNEMLVRLVVLVHFCSPSYIAVKMANCVKIKMNEKVMRLKSSTLTVGNLAMIFKLDMDQGIAE